MSTQGKCELLLPRCLPAPPGSRRNATGSVCLLGARTSGGHQFRDPPLKQRGNHTGLQRPEAQSVGGNAKAVQSLPFCLLFSAFSSRLKRHGRITVARSPLPSENSLASAHCLPILHDTEWSRRRSSGGNCEQVTAMATLCPQLPLLMREPHPSPLEDELRGCQACKPFHEGYAETDAHVQRGHASACPVSRRHSDAASSN